MRALLFPMVSAAAPPSRERFINQAQILKKINGGITQLSKVKNQLSGRTENLTLCSRKIFGSSASFGTGIVVNTCFDFSGFESDFTKYWMLLGVMTTRDT